jgi:hypothetical protein
MASASAALHAIGSDVTDEAVEKRAEVVSAFMIR